MNRKRVHSNKHSGLFTAVLVILVVVVLLWYLSSSLVGTAYVFLAPSAVSINSKMPVLQDSVLKFTVSPPTSSVYVVYKKAYWYNADVPATNGWKELAISSAINSKNNAWAFIIPSRGVAALSGSLSIPLSQSPGTYRAYFLMREWTGKSWSDSQWVRKDISVISKNYCPVSGASECQGSVLRSCTSQHEWVQQNCDKGCYQKTSAKANCKVCTEGEQFCSDGRELKVCTDYEWSSRNCDIACDNDACIEFPSGDGNASDSQDDDFADSAPQDEALPQGAEEKLCDDYEFEKSILSNASASLPGYNPNKGDGDWLHVTQKGNIRFFQSGLGMVLLSPEGAFIKNVSRDVFGVSPDGKVYFLEKTFDALNFGKGVLQYSEELVRVGVPWKISFSPWMTNPILPAIVDSAKRIYIAKASVSGTSYEFPIYSPDGQIIGYLSSSMYGLVLTKSVYPVNNLIYAVSSEKYGRFNKFKNTLHVSDEKYLDPSIPIYQKSSSFSYVELNLSYLNDLPVLNPTPEHRPVAALRGWADHLFYLTHYGIKVFTKAGEGVKEFLINPDYNNPATGISNTSVLYNAMDIAFDKDSNLYALSVSQNGPVIRKYACKMDAP